MDIRSDEHIFIAGRTGSGKTTLAKEILKPVRRLIVCDSKGTLRGWNAGEWADKESRKKFEQGDAIRLRAAPPIGDDSPEFWDAIFESAYYAGDCRIYIDELYGVVPTVTQAPPFLKVIYTRGREFNVSMCALTQRPSWVPLFCMSESSHYFCFKLNMPEDRARMAAFMGEEVREPIKDKHGFFYYGGDLDAPIYYPEYQLHSNKVPEGKSHGV